MFWYNVEKAYLCIEETNKIMTTLKLVTTYEKRLNTVVAMWKDNGERGQEYIQHAKESLEAVKNGREW